MNLGLFYDTETTGLPSKHRNDDAPSQPHLVQLAAHLADMDTRQVIQSMDFIIRPDGWEIPPEVSEIHGITQEHALAVGVSEKSVLSMFVGLWTNAGTRIAHNEEFDAKIMRIALMRYQGKMAADTWRAGKAECTCNMTQPIMQLPPSQRMVAAGIGGYKKPRMEEAYKHFTGKTLENAHTAIADVNACMEVYWAAKDSQSTGV